MKWTPSFAQELLEKCSVCPRGCGVNRVRGQTGYCRAGFNPKVYSYSPHHGEEPVLSGARGSGTIFFTHCTMKCVYCQNYYFSQLDEGDEVSIEGLAAIMSELEKAGCHNVNLVSPTHYVPQIAAALERAREKGLKIPVVYNSGGYDTAETIRRLEGLIDIYMPDMRYGSDEMAKAYSDAGRYVEFNRGAVREMQKQVGDLVCDEEGIARRGLIIRLLVLPEGASGTKETLRFIAKEISKNSYLSIMSQYYPTFKAYNYEALSRGVTQSEYREVVEEAIDLGLENGWVQDLPSGVDARFAGTNIKPGRKKDG